METSGPFTHMTRLDLSRLGQEATKHFPKEFPRPLPPGLFLFFVAMGVLRHFLGPYHFDRLVSPNLRAPTFLTPVEGTVPAHMVAMLRVTDFAETLFNLQWIEGFQHALEEFCGASDLQTGVHTLDIGFLLKQAGLRFRFRKAPGTEGLGNHDIDLYHEEWTIPVEAKAKRSTTKPTKRHLEETLSYAGHQLPTDAPSIITIRLPPEWAREVGDIAPIRRWIGIFLSSHPAIVRVVALLEVPGLPKGAPLRGFAVIDEPNHAQIFGPSLGGPLFKSDVSPSDRWLFFKEFLKLVPRPSQSILEEGRRALRVCPRSFAFLTELSDHHPDRRPA